MYQFSIEVVQTGLISFQKSRIQVFHSLELHRLAFKFA
jgi:hypothetical protein